MQRLCSRKEYQEILDEYGVVIDDNIKVKCDDKPLMTKVKHDDMERTLGMGIGAIGTPNEPNDPSGGHLCLNGVMKPLT